MPPIKSHYENKPWQTIPYGIGSSLKIGIKQSSGRHEFPIQPIVPTCIRHVIMLTI